MNYKKLQSAIKHISTNCKCVDCNSKYRQKDIYIIATSDATGLFELICPKCKLRLIVTVSSGNEIDEIREHKMLNSEITQNELLDIKNFLNKFDGNFKKLFNS